MESPPSYEPGTNADVSPEAASSASSASAADRPGRSVSVRARVSNAVRWLKVQTEPHLARFRSWLSPARGIWLVVLALSASALLIAGIRLLLPALAWVAALPRFGLVAWAVVGLVGTTVALFQLRDLQAPQKADRSAPKQPLPLPVLIALVIVSVSVSVGLIIALAWWAMGARVPVAPDEFTVGHLNAISIRAFAVVAGLGATALLVINYRRQLTTEAESRRGELKLFDERFTNAYTELGNENQAVRLGAVHALANLADDAPKDREDLVQTVIDVLCAYIRMPYAPAPEEPREGESPAAWTRYRELKQEFESTREVRHTILRIIGSHLREETRWRGKNYDFSQAVFDGGNFAGARFTGGRVNFRGATFAGGHVNLIETRFTGAHVSFIDTRFTGGVVYFSEARFHGGQVEFRRTEFDGAKVHFFGADFASGVVSFPGTRFTGGLVDFGDTTDNPARGVVPVGLTEAVSRGTPGVVHLPPEWEDGRGDPPTF
ncbi:pentapeptide repeat-containing protein [Nocardiopsis exhalans]|uniref:Pentapeptide repeat-containing protein n=1 Tax=Nocardiopsis exhalans TaxID=163604 RepID=A0ABY5DBU5_9ACTN|nr:pentapeptide repeat-containing protein [Nocardiopsis exhalans]USY21829.1 pentapeptide repeat-containing protein [Nocardiopsis exhalans]